MRGKSAKKRDIKPDSVYGSVVLSKFINYLMLDGKKTIAESIVHRAIADAAKKGDKKPLDLFDEAIKNVAPQVEVRSKRVGGANYQVPMPVRGSRQHALAFRWIIDAARKKKGADMATKLSQVLLDACENTGDAIKKRDDVHRMAEANKAFAHFARFR